MTEKYQCFYDRERLLDGLVKSCAPVTVTSAKTSAYRRKHPGSNADDVPEFAVEDRAAFEAEQELLRRVVNAVDLIRLFTALEGSHCEEGGTASPLRDHALKSLELVLDKIEGQCTAFREHLQTLSDDNAEVAALLTTAAQLLTRVSMSPELSKCVDNLPTTQALLLKYAATRVDTNVLHELIDRLIEVIDAVRVREDHSLASEMWEVVAKLWGLYSRRGHVNEAFEQTLQIPSRAHRAKVGHPIRHLIRVVASLPVAPEHDEERHRWAMIAATRVAYDFVQHGHIYSNEKTERRIFGGERFCDFEHFQYWGTLELYMSFVKRHHRGDEDDKSPGKNERIVDVLQRIFQVTNPAKVAKIIESIDCDSDLYSTYGTIDSMALPAELDIPQTVESRELFEEYLNGLDFVKYKLSAKARK